MVIVPTSVWGGQREVLNALSLSVPAENEKATRRGMSEAPRVTLRRQVATVAAGQGLTVQKGKTSSVRMRSMMCQVTGLAQKLV